MLINRVSTEVRNESQKSSIFEKTRKAKKRDYVIGLEKNKRLSVPPHKNKALETTINNDPPQLKTGKLLLRDKLASKIF